MTGVSPSPNVGLMSMTVAIPPHALQYSVVLIKAKGNGPFMLQRRPKARGVLYPGRIGLFGGRREGAETPVETAIREVEEEASLKLRPEQLQLLARIIAHDEAGDLSFGHIFLAEGLDARMLRRLKIRDGRAVFCGKDRWAGRCREMTSITNYAIQAYIDLKTGST